MDVMLVVEKALTADQVTTVKKALAKVSGVTNIVATAGSKEITVSIDPAKTSPEKVIAALANAGIATKKA